MFKIMLIDDDVPMLKVLQQMMDWEQLSLSLIGSAYSSVKALQMFKELLPDIVITDIGMPQMDGLQLSAEFKKIKPRANLLPGAVRTQYGLVQAIVLSAAARRQPGTFTPAICEAIRDSLGLSNVHDCIRNDFLGGDIAEIFVS